MSPTHRIHVWYIYLHLLQKSIKCRSIYHRWMVWAMKLRGLKANNRWHIHLVERCPTCPTLSMPSFYSPKEVQAVTPGHLCFCNALKLGSWNTSWWFFTNPSEKYPRQIGANFPKFWVENKKCLSCHHRKRWCMMYPSNVTFPYSNNRN